MTTDQKFCKRMLAEWAGGEHHLPKCFPFGEGVCINWYGDLSTYDFDRLTSLVLLAHRDGIRIGILNSGPRMVRICAHRRETGPRNGRGSCQWHPSLEDLAKRVAEMMPADNQAAMEG